jgi:hypothetical protein
MTNHLTCYHAGVVMTGSHADAIPLAGAYDGTLGVVGAIAAVKALKDAGFKPKHSIEVLMFTSEEPTRFGLGCLGRCAHTLHSVQRLVSSVHGETFGLWRKAELLATLLAILLEVLRNC